MFTNSLGKWLSVDGAVITPQSDIGNITFIQDYASWSRKNIREFRTRNKNIVKSIPELEISEKILYFDPLYRPDNLIPANLNMLQSLWQTSNQYDFFGYIMIGPKAIPGPYSTYYNSLKYSMSADGNSYLWATDPENMIAGYPWCASMCQNKWQNAETQGRALRVISTRAFIIIIYYFLLLMLIQFFRDTKITTPNCPMSVTCFIKVPSVPTVDLLTMDLLTVDLLTCSYPLFCLYLLLSLLYKCPFFIFLFLKFNPPFKLNKPLIFTNVVFIANFYRYYTTECDLCRRRSIFMYIDPSCEISEE